ncbi:MAG: anion permease [Candidatus Cloacimonetes bacterium]|nr:anion permease [Candidatus Cloacimonadota bacterium]
MDQVIVFATLGAALVLFVWGKIRYDFVALIALFIVTIFRIIPTEEAFSGFGHPAVITVAAVMVISKGLQNSGLIDLIGRWTMKLGKSIILQVFALSIVVAVASAFMNNVGALAIMMPVAIHLARKSGNPPSYLLMPIAFASLLGGMMTMIGTPPNIIIATFRQDVTGTPFRLFDFTPVGLPLVVSGIVIISLLGWRLLPKRKGQDSQEDSFHIDDYITEVRVTKESKIRGKTIADIHDMKDIEITILGLIRRKQRIHAPDNSEVLKLNDIIILEADSDSIRTFVDISGVKLMGGKQFRKDALGSKDIAIREAIVMNDSKLAGKTAASLNMRSKYGINLLAVARNNKRLRNRLDHIKFRPGDVLLLQGRNHNLSDTINNIGCLPLAERGLRIGYQKKIPLTLGIFGLGILAVVTGILPVQIAFTLAALLIVLTKVVSFREVYDDIDWSIIILLGAMIPVGIALQLSGGADLIADQILLISSGLPIWFVLTLLMIVTMLLSDIINNAATAVLMAPIAINIAQGFNVSLDPFLMVIAVGASSAFLTPIGHQSNTLVMGPGGYKFSDYWKLGLPLEILIVIISIPLILNIWPL